MQTSWSDLGDDDTTAGSFASDMSKIGPVVAGGAGIGILSVIFSLSALCCRAKPQDCPSMCSLVTAAIAAFIAGMCNTSCGELAVVSPSLTRDPPPPLHCADQVWPCVAGLLCFSTMSRTRMISRPS